MAGTRGRVANSGQKVCAASEASESSRSRGKDSFLANSCWSCEVAIIKEAYNACNFTSIRDLPDKLKAGEVSQRLREKRDLAFCPRLLESDKDCVRKRGLFRAFEYMPERYSVVEELHAREKQENEAKELAINGGKRFLVPGRKKALKHEDCFRGDRSTLRYSGDPYEALQQEKLRAKWLDKSKILHGPFLPVGAGTDFTEPTRALLPEMISLILDKLANDWERYGPQVHLTDHGTLAIRFNLEFVDCIVGLTAYMNNMQANDTQVLRYRLRKIPKKWGLQPGDGYV